jgi:hypothetical protein
MTPLGRPLFLRLADRVALLARFDGNFACGSQTYTGKSAAVRVVISSLLGPFMAPIPRSRHCTSSAGFGGLPAVCSATLDRQIVTHMYGPAVRHKKFRRTGFRSCINDGMDSPAFHGRNRSKD